METICLIIFNKSVEEIYCFSINREDSNKTFKELLQIVLDRYGVTFEEEDCEHYITDNVDVNIEDSISLSKINVNVITKKDNYDTGTI